MIWRVVFGFVSKLFLSVVPLVAMWFGGRKAAQADIKAEQAQRNLKTVVRAEEIENEVEALDIDTLKRRSVKWVRSSK
jgi:hypothetical protein